MIFISAQRWPAPSKGVHDDYHLFPFNFFDSLDEMRKSLTWFGDEVVPAGFKATDLLLHFAYDPGSGELCSFPKGKKIMVWFTSMF